MQGTSHQFLAAAALAFDQHRKRRRRRPIDRAAHVGHDAAQAKNLVGQARGRAEPARHAGERRRRRRRRHPQDGRGLCCVYRRTRRPARDDRADGPAAVADRCARGNAFAVRVWRDRLIDGKRALGHRGVDPSAVTGRRGGSPATRHDKRDTGGTQPAPHTSADRHQRRPLFFNRLTDRQHREGVVQARRGVRRRLRRDSRARTASAPAGLLPTRAARRPPIGSAGVSRSRRSAMRARTISGQAADTRATRVRRAGRRAGAALPSVALGRQQPRPQGAQRIAARSGGRNRASDIPSHGGMIADAEVSKGRRRARHGPRAPDRRCAPPLRDSRRPWRPPDPARGGPPPIATTRTPWRPRDDRRPAAARALRAAASPHRNVPARTAPESGQGDWRPCGRGLRRREKRPARLSAASRSQTTPSVRF